MKKIYLFLALWLTVSSYCCPMCIGKLKKNSPAFFSEEFNQALDAEDNEETTIQIDAHHTETTITEEQSCVLQK